MPSSTTWCRPPAEPAPVAHLHEGRDGAAVPRQNLGAHDPAVVAEEALDPLLRRAGRQGQDEEVAARDVAGRRGGAVAHDQRLGRAVKLDLVQSLFGRIRLVRLGHVHNGHSVGLAAGGHQAHRGDLAVDREELAYQLLCHVR
eukprot:CAMPEP_0168434454 /NCGR_PEP_ID=MMETSP0228-20121227/39915_1 /TAXON_ID=133427 /ORGANISM="Protoceratium reticulatum, Strain CCCM 535 (=CCMP 1889)" /LENGTH=142 /DNA_ID=CAMNT_0008448613 /DNA_START=115 /DNA_END=540 /DNA_ORIENTATION=+